MIALTISFVITFFLVVVWGILISKILKLNCLFTEKLLLGLVVINTLSTMFSLFVPINIYITVIYIFLTLILVFFIKKQLLDFILQIKEKKFVIFFAIPFILVGFILAISSPGNYDTGLYHLQTIKWIESFSAVPGLANLHGRFGFNPNIFTLFALTSLSDLFKQEIFSINFTLFSIFVFYFINTLFEIFSKNGISNLFIFNTFVFVVILGLRNLDSPSPDYISVTFPLFIFTRMLNIGKFSNNNFKQYTPILLLSVYAITVKLATLPILLLWFFILLEYKKETTKILGVIILSSIIIIPWVIRNIILTGWIIYPFYHIDLFSFDWKVPIENLKSESVDVTAWARNPGPGYRKAYTMTFFEWFPIWWNNLNSLRKIYLSFALCFPVIVFIAYLLKKIKIDFYIISIILTSYLGVLFIILFGPDFRFGKSFIFISALVPILFFKFKIDIKRIFFYKPVYLFIFIAMILLFKFGLTGTPIKILKSFDNYIVTPGIIKRSPENLSFKTVNINNIIFNLPTVGDRCFDHSIPCTPYLQCVKSIELRNETLQHGFRYKKIK